MALAKRYLPAERELALQARWQANGVYQYRGGPDDTPYVVDTPPPTVSGHLHLGHVYSYSHPDFLARYFRMRGRDVLYPMGYDDNGLPTERLVERHLGARALEVGRAAFIQACLQVSAEAEREYEGLWRRLGLSVDWRHRYRTIDASARRLSQLSFLDLVRRDLAYRRKAPAIWCPECGTAIAQAELADLDREGEFVTLAFRLDNGARLPIATTRPELLPACVAVFVHPDDERVAQLAGRLASVPLFGQEVPILADPAADPQKGTGMVMCCTFGDATDVAWWYTYGLDLVEVLDAQGRLAAPAGRYAGLDVGSARQRIKADLDEAGLVLERRNIEQSIRVHDRCDTPVEYVVGWQWFIRVLDHKEALLALGEQVEWHPAHMKERFRSWVENLSWDWCISRQRYYGVTFPVWYCADCGQTILADESLLPVDPTVQRPGQPCNCGSSQFKPETDVMDTWATSSVTPMLVGHFLGKSGFDGEPFETLSLRPQGHEIIRTWAFYSIVKAYHHFGRLPWQALAVSGWGLAPEGGQKISKSRGGGPVAPLEIIERYSADAVRYWAASTGFGKDAVISEEKIQAGAKLVTKLWNVARFSQRFLDNSPPAVAEPSFTPADRWILSRCQQLITRATALMDSYEYATAKSEIEQFFWSDLADNYLEMAKKRLYDNSDPAAVGARQALVQLLLAVLKLLAPFLPHVTEEIYLALYASDDPGASIHRSEWPVPDEALIDAHSERTGQWLVQIATAVRKYKSQQNLSLGADLPALIISCEDAGLAFSLRAAESDLVSVTRASGVRVEQTLPEDTLLLDLLGPVTLALAHERLQGRA